MTRKYFRQIVKLSLIALFIYLIDFSGIFQHLFELDYEQFFEYPHDNNTSNHQWHIQEAQSYSNSYTFIYNASNKCKGPVSPHITFIIKSALDNHQNRAIIRKTWGYEKRFSDVAVKLVFLLGISSDKKLMKLVEGEAAKTDDIVQANFVDSYFNNTIKTVMGMQWAVQHCSQSKYFMFVDDDYYISLKNALRYIKDPAHYPAVQRSNIATNENNEVLFAGFVMQTSPHRHKFSKWYVTLSEYPFSLWPPYVTAGAFILSRNALLKIYSTSLKTRPFRFDDIFLGIVALRANIKLTHSDYFHFKRPSYNGPESFRNVIASHGFDDVDYLESVWANCRSANVA